MTRQYMAAGVGVRLKSMKPPKAAPVPGDLFGSAGVATEAPKPGEPAKPAEPAAQAEAAREAPRPEAAPTPEVPRAAQPSPPAQLSSDPQPEPAKSSGTATLPAPSTKLSRKKERIAAPSGEVPTPKAAKSKRGRKSLKQISAEADLIEIPSDESLFSKQYYTMGEVSEMFRVNQSLLRFWETEFDIIQPRKNKKGDRYFRPIDIKNLHLIYHLLRQRKYTIEGAKEFLKNNKKAEVRFEAIQRLQDIRAFLQEWKGHINF
ncbi:MAG TPA: MerR family transcriptional regulator [Puia sp.]